MKTRIGILIIILVSTLSLPAQDKIYIWSEIDPGWKTRSIYYWANVRGYGKSVPGEMSGLISEYYSVAEKKLDLTLKEHFINSGIPKTVIPTVNPGSVMPNDGDLFLDLQCMILETSYVYPNFRTRKLNIVPVIQYKLTLYDAGGDVVGSGEILDKIDYKNKIRPLLRGMSDHRRDIEIVRHSFIQSLSGPVIGIIESRIAELITPLERKQVKPDPARFRQVVEILFDNRKLQFPGEYQDVRFEPVTTSIIDRKKESNTLRDLSSNPGGFDDLSSLVGAGNYYALLIGINDYSDPTVTDLAEPVNDAQRLYNTLVNNYTFDEEYVIFLSNPTREQIIQSFDKLAMTITSVDNLLIFYAGHGLWDKQLEKGFWLPSDAAAKNRTNWFSNSGLRDYIGGIKSKHTLLISDACFSGSIFKTREPFTNVSTATLELYKHPSRKAMTSGNMTMVPDKSVFVDYLIKRLEENTDYSISSEQLFASFKIAVINNSATSQIPQFGEIRESGDEGGDFLFIRRMKQ